MGLLTGTVTVDGEGVISVTIPFCSEATGEVEEDEEGLKYSSEGGEEE